MAVRLDPSQTSRTARRLATWGSLPLSLAGGFAGGRALRPRRHLPLPPPFEAEQGELHIPFGRIASYRAGPTEGTPLLLIHSVNAAASAYEIKPLFEHYARDRPVYALDLPGFGSSDRHDRIYTPRLMTDAILAVVEDIRRVHGHFPINAMALSLSAEFLARAAQEHPTSFRSIGLISPTGFDTRVPRKGSGPTFGMPAVRDVISFPLWGRALFDLLTSRKIIRFFLQKTWGGKNIDEGLLDYDYASAHQPGAEHAPFSFVSGFLFSRDALTMFKDLTAPVWMCHGVRGDFVDYSKKSEIADRANWTIQTLPTGALPQFEALNEMTASYDGFLSQVV